MAGGATVLGQEDAYQKELILTLEAMGVVTTSLLNMALHVSEIHTQTDSQLG